jgi:hypothetical protein
VHLFGFHVSYCCEPAQTDVYYCFQSISADDLLLRLRDLLHSEAVRYFFLVLLAKLFKELFVSKLRIFHQVVFCFLLDLFVSKHDGVLALPQQLCLHSPVVQ